MRKSATKRLENAKNFIVPYVKEKGKVSAGTFTLGTRKSSSTEIDEGFNNPLFMREKIVMEPDKDSIKEAIKRGDEIPGCRIVEKYHLTIK